jgi:hypothetical protein
MARITKSLTFREEDLAAIPPFSLLDGTCDISVVCQAASEQCSIAEHCIQDIYPCSPMQEGLLALSMKDPGAYILQFVYHMPESVDLDKLNAAWETVAKRIQVLRTRFFDYNSDLLQVVVEEPLRWDVVEGGLATFLATEKEQIMELGETMSRQTVLRHHDPVQCYLVWTVHHALIDRWSESEIVASVEQEYLGHSSAASTTPTFNSFIKYIGQQDKELAQDFWRQQLTDAPAPIFPRLPDPSYVPKVQRPNRVLHHLTSHAVAGSATFATMIQAAWFLLIGIHSNTSEVITGVTLNGRAAQLPCIDLIPGPTLTTVPFRTRFTPDQKVSDLLQDIQNQWLRILPFAHFGLQNIGRLSGDALAACKFRSLLVVQSANRRQDQRKLLRRKTHAFPTMEFAIVMECELSKGSIDFRATFDPQILSEGQVRRMCQQMEDILHRISLNRPSTRVSDLQKISQSDMLQIFQWNTPGDAPQIARSRVHDLIEQRTREQGNAPAVCAWDGELSYETLDMYSSRLAVHLQIYYQVGPECLVAICFDKSLWVVVSMLAVLKAGGTCVPINPSDPTGRLQTIMSKSGDNCANPHSYFFITYRASQ